MQLPIDFQRAPLKQKYIDEDTQVTARWGIFGHNVDDPNLVFVCDTYTDVFINVPRDVAERIVAARNAFVDALLLEMYR